MAFKGFKFRLYPTEEQKVLLGKHFGCVRFVYNQALELKNEYYQENKKTLSKGVISAEMTQWKKTEERKWLKEVNSQCIQFALINLDTAFVNFFNKLSDFPKFKKKHNRQSFSCPQSGKVDFENSLFSCPKFKKGIKCIFHRQFEGKIKTCTVSKTPTNRYFVSILVEQPHLPEKLPLELDKCLGIDLGISTYATFSDGTKIENPRHLKKKLKKLKRACRQHSKKKKGSKNKEKSRLKLAKQYEKVTNTRKDFQHKLSHQIAENQGYTSVAMETLNIEGMIKNHCLAQHIQDAAWFQFKSFLKYKLEDRGKTLLEIGRFEPSSKMCTCGSINSKLTLKDRKWTCHCGLIHDRDILAANNIKNFAFVGRDTPEQDFERNPTPLEIAGCGDL